MKKLGIAFNPTPVSKSENQNTWTSGSKEMNRFGEGLKTLPVGRTPREEGA